MNTILEDIGAEIGFTATTALVAWFGGGNLYVPASISDMHPIAKAIGMRPAQRLVAAWGSETLWIPDGAQEERHRRDRLIAELLAAQKPVKEIATVTGIHRRRVQQISVQLEESGLLRYVQETAPSANAGQKTPAEKPVGKPGRKTQGKRPVGKAGAK